MREMFRRLAKDESGASLIEYVLIAGIISIVGIGLMIAIGGDVTTILTNTQGATGQGATASGAAAAG